MGLKALCALFQVTLVALCIGCRRPSTENGAALYGKDCARCHTRQEGQAAPAPVLSGYFFRNPQPEMCEVRALIRDGRRAMPPFGKRLSSRQMDDLIAYLKTLR